MTNKLLAAAIASSLAASTALASEVANWHLLTQAENGHVSLVKGLTKGQCERMKHDLTTFVPDCPLSYGGNCGYSVRPSDIKFSECFQ